MMVRLRELKAGCIVTFKGPCRRGKFKKRQEVNFAGNDAAAAHKFLASLGLKRTFSKEKNRRQWHYGAVCICMDRVPCIGDYVEIEGGCREITVVARKLGFCPQAALKDSYESLFSLFCTVRAQKTDKIFKKKEFSFRFERLLKSKALL